MSRILPVSILTVALSLSGQDARDAIPRESYSVSLQVQRAVDQGLEYLARTQAENGAFGNGQAPVATTALAGMAFLAAGHVPGRSKYSATLNRCVDYLIDNTSRMGYINEGVDLGRGGSGMHGHGYAILFLTQVYGMANDPSAPELGKIKGILTRAVRVSERAQWTTGGWYYHPTPSGDEGSVTVTQVQALRAAHNAGIRVDLPTIVRAIEYIDKVTSDAGTVRYKLSSHESETTMALSAAGLCSMTYLGQYSHAKIDRGLDFILRRFTPGQGPNQPMTQSMFYYGNYYASLAMFQGGDRYWKHWYPPLCSTLLAAQSESGAWTGGETAQYGEAFGTSLALLSLEIPFRYLPIFQRAQD